MDVNQRNFKVKGNGYNETYTIENPGESRLTVVHSTQSLQLSNYLVTTMKINNVFTHSYFSPF